MGTVVLIVDDHELFSTTLRMALAERGIEAHQVVPTDYPAILARAAELPPGIIALDLDLGWSAGGDRLRGAELVGELRRAGWRVLVVSGHGPDDPDSAAAVAAGAVGVVPKLSSLETLVATVAKVVAGEPVIRDADRQRWLAADRAHRAREQRVLRLLGRLSPREREVLELLAQGHRAAVIAERFMVSLTTVRTQIRSILAKLEVSSQIEAVALLPSTRELP